MLRDGPKIPVMAQVRTGKGRDMRTHLALKTREHIEFLGLIEGQIAARVDVFSSARPTDRWL